MTGLALQIDGKWAVLSEGDSVNIENNSPVWGEGNSFSLPFELDIEANRHILGNADQITGQSVYEVLDGKRAVLYTLGIPVYYGKIKMEDEVELSEGKVDVTLVSGNLTFDEMIDGMNCQDVELLEEFPIGRELRALAFDFGNDDILLPSFRRIEEYKVEPKRFVTHLNHINVSDPYPVKKYCNVAVCTQKKEERDYWVFEADRPATGICFYVLYFLDCLFAKLGIDVSKNELMSIEDMCRLAFFSTSCEYKTVQALPSEEIYGVPFFGLTKAEAIRTGGGYSDAADAVFPRTNHMYATSKNFPNADVSEIMEGISSAFGVVVLYEEKNQEIRLKLVKNILKDTDIRTVYAEIYETWKTENNTVGFELSYSSGDDDNTSFNYSDYSNVNSDRDYATMRKNVSPYDKTLYIDKKTGDAFRIKIDEEALSDSEKELNPSLFEVGEFVSAKYGDCTDESRVEKKEIPFVPIIANDISKVDGVSNYKIFIDADMGDYGAQNVYSESLGDYGTFSILHGGEGAGNWTETIQYNRLKIGISYEGYNYSQAGDNSGGTPINKYDAGFTLGILRPGEGSGVVDDERNYDGEGNFKYYFVAENSAFISDTIDHYGYSYDYNGSLEGGVDPSGRFSLKPRAEKPNPEGGFYPITESYAQRRGLFDKFYSEYAYFVVNRKIVRMKCRMEMADLLNIDWTKRYRIGEYVGFINKYSYSVSSTGISDVELEMYYI